MRQKFIDFVEEMKLEDNQIRCIEKFNERTSDEDTVPLTAEFTLEYIKTNILDYLHILDIASEWFQFKTDH